MWIATTGVANAAAHLPLAAASLVVEANATVMVRDWIAVSVQAPVPEHGCVHPVKRLPPPAAAVSVSAVLAGYVAEQPVAAATPLVTTQSMAGESPTCEVTRPLPVPPPTSLTVNGPLRKRVSTVRV